MRVRTHRSGAHLDEEAGVKVALRHARAWTGGGRDAGQRITAACLSLPRRNAPSTLRLKEPAAPEPMAAMTSSMSSPAR